MSNSKNIYKFDYEEETDFFDPRQETFYHFALNDKCNCCRKSFTENCLHYIEFNWLVRPRKTPFIHPYDATLSMYLCGECFDFYTFNPIKLIGWDKWDALDGIQVPSLKISKLPKFLSKL